MPPNIELQEASLGPPGLCFAPSSSLNIYFESDIGGSACLFPSKHKGHERFLTEAEFFKEKFLASMQEGRYLECSDVVTALAYKLMGEGNIYERKLGNQNLLQGQQWQPVFSFNDVRDLVFRALLVHYKANTNAVAATDETSDAAAVLAAMPHQKQRDHKENASSSLVGGPEWLLQAASANTAAPRRMVPFKRDTVEVDASQTDKVAVSKPPQILNEPTPKSPGSSKKEDEPAQPSTAITSPASSLQEGQAQSAPQTCSPGDFIGEINTNDVFCNDRREDGVPKIGHVGNVLLHRRISRMAAAFAEASIEKKGEYALECVDMVLQLSGRFLVKVSEADSAMKKSRFTELPLEDARWRVYWALEKSPITAPVSRKKAKKPKTSTKRQDASGLSPAQAVPTELGDGEKNAESQTGRESPPIVLEHIPTHLTFVSKVDSAARTLLPPAATPKDQPVGTTVSVSSSEGSTIVNKVERIRRRREKLQRAKDILAGRQSADPFGDMAELRRASIEELKKRQKRTQVRKRLATWDPDE